MIYIYICLCIIPKYKTWSIWNFCYTKEFSWWPILWLSWLGRPLEQRSSHWLRWFLRYKKKGLQRFPSSKVHFFRCTAAQQCCTCTDVWGMCVAKVPFLCHSHLGTNESCLGKCTGSSWLCMGQEAGWCKDLSGLVLCAAWPVALRNPHFASDLDRLGENQGSNRLTRLTPRIS